MGSCEQSTSASIPNRASVPAKRSIEEVDGHCRVEPDAKRRHVTAFDRTHEATRIIFNKTIAGCYRDGHAEYDDVGVLLITWGDDDMNCKTTEVDRLEHVFRSRFNFGTEYYEIPSSNPEAALHSRITDFAYCYDSPNKLSIIYYGGHASGDGDRDLRLFATQHENSPFVSFKEIFNTLKLPDADILFVIDCCCAGQAFARQAVGKRKFELLSATSATDWARAARQDGSFTLVFTKVLEELLNQKPRGFSTSELYREIYFRQHHKRIPFLFNQSQYDYGMIWLRPLETKAKSEVNSVAKEDEEGLKYSIDLRLNLTKMPGHTEMNNLAKALQYLPHVRKLEF